MFELGKKYFLPSGLVGFVTFAVAWILKQVNVNVLFSTIDVREKLEGGLGTAVGEKVFGLFGDIAIPNIGYVLVTSVVITILGAYLWSFSPVPRKSPSVFVQWSAILFIGSVVTMAITTMGLSFIMSLTSMIALAFYSLIIGGIMTLIFSHVIKGWMPPLPK